MCKIFPKETLKYFAYKEARAIAVNVNLKLTKYLLSEFYPKETKSVCVNQVHLSLWVSIALGGRGKREPGIHCLHMRLIS